LHKLEVNWSDNISIQECIQDVQINVAAIPLKSRRPPKHYFERPVSQLSREKKTLIRVRKKKKWALANKEPIVLKIH